MNPKAVLDARQSDNLYCRAAGYISFLRSVVRSGEDLTPEEHEAVDTVIKDLMAAGLPDANV